MLIDGKVLAARIKLALKGRIASFPQPLSIAVFWVGDNKSSASFIKVKEKFGKDIGVAVKIFHLPESIGEDELLREVESEARKRSGVLIQLPLPGEFDRGRILASIPVSKDIDLLSGEAFELFTSNRSPIVPPVVGAVRMIFEAHKIEPAHRSVVVLGNGRLVGEPVVVWLKQKGIRPTVLSKETFDEAIVRKADIIISGMGSPHFLKPGMLKEGVVLIDAGTSELSSSLSGDADPACAAKCSLFTPVPGGVGPLTVAALFENLLVLAQQSREIHMEIEGA
jgi:methylenetetrahydrofolate dehydrogenase (NADP+)/methenyltetrahydrofolate cyclohydrolase